MEKSRAVGAAHLTCLSFADSTPPPRKIFAFIAEFPSFFISGTSLQ